MRRVLLILTAALCTAMPLKAQFVLTGDDPGYLKWYSIQTPYYNIIYPQGADSLALRYGRLLEAVRPAVGLSLGFTPGEGQHRMPVVLHTHNPYSNGSVAWAPKRMDLYTLPEAYGSDPAPWEIQLAAHEPRHQAQLELDRHGFGRFLSYVIGQAWTPVAFEMYLSRCLAEGDAVTVETGLSAGTRARTADFLNYYRVALDSGDYRNWYRWRYGSYKNYTPDLYKLGYITVAGSRALYYDPLIMGQALEKSRRNIFNLSTLNLRRVIRDRSGLKFKQAFPEILDMFGGVWQADALERAPFAPMEQVSREESFPVSYQSLASLDGRLYMIRSGYLRTPELGVWEDGKFCSIRSFSSSASSLFASPSDGRLYWTETVRDPRWSLAGKSVIRYYSKATGKVRDLTGEGRLYNPQPSGDGSLIAAVSYPWNGGSAVEVLSTKDGSIVRRFAAPDGIQACESAWIGDTLYVSGLSEKGYGIYLIGADGTWRTELEPSIQKLVNLGADGQSLIWVSDLNGVNERYRYTPASGELVRQTSSRYGATDYAVQGEYLYGVSQTLGGKMLFRTPVDSLAAISADFSREHVYPIEDAITRQEKSFRKPASEPVEFSAPKRYSKIGHLMRFHSWAPVFFDPDNVSSFSMDYLFDAAAPGATGYFQNTLSTMSGMVGFAVRPDPDDEKVWRPSLHAKFTYSGLYPVIEGGVDFGDSKGQILAKVSLTEDGETVPVMGSGRRDALMVSGWTRVYVPLAQSKGGVSYGFVPQVTYSITNSIFDRAPRGLTVTTDPSTGEKASAWEEGHVPSYVPMQRLGVSARGYYMLGRAVSQIYPRWGIGAEAGVNLRPGMASDFRPNLYAYMYGYLPGIRRTQGLKLTGIFQQQLPVAGDEYQVGEMAANTLPRGFSAAARTSAGRLFAWQWKATLDYAVPVYAGDIALPPVAYIRNFLVIPHADFTGLSGGANLWSVGADITAQFGKLLLPFDGSIGVSFSYLGGSAFDAVGQSKRWYVGMIMSYDLQ